MIKYLHLKKNSLNIFVHYICTVSSPFFHPGILENWGSPICERTRSKNGEEANYFYKPVNDDVLTFSPIFSPILSTVSNGLTITVVKILIHD